MCFLYPRNTNCYPPQPLLAGLHPNTPPRVPPAAATRGHTAELLLTSRSSYCSSVSPQEHHSVPYASFPARQEQLPVPPTVLPAVTHIPMPAQRYLLQTHH